MKLTIGLLMFAFIALPFCIAGYQLGKLHGVEEARRVVEVERAEHDDFMRSLGACRWAAEFAKQIECAGEQQ